LDADHPENGVLIPCRNTVMTRKTGIGLEEQSALTVCLAPIGDSLPVMTSRLTVVSVMVRLLTVAWACNTIMVVVFLQFNLISKHLQH
ncbi:MAG: hypothetical protein PSV22_04130, partial [Pseudolabrys sp.]|nr:hypothetical protein [Pseudolabrys sp.]